MLCWWLCPPAKGISGQPVWKSWPQLSRQILKKSLKLNRWQRSANSSCKVSLFFDAFRRLLRGVLQFNTKHLYLWAIVSRYKGTNDHKGLVGPTNRNRLNCENLKFFGGKAGEFIWGTRFWFSFFVTHDTQQVTKCEYNSSWCLSGCHRCLFRCLHCLLQQ